MVEPIDRTTTTTRPTLRHIATTNNTPTNNCNNTNIIAPGGTRRHRWRHWRRLSRRLRYQSSLRHHQPHRHRHETNAHTHTQPHTAHIIQPHHQRARLGTRHTERYMPTWSQTCTTILIRPTRTACIIQANPEHTQQTTAPDQTPPHIRTHHTSDNQECNKRAPRVGAGEG